MPCYYDDPSEDNQVEIQRRCKETMYFDAVAILNKENLAKAKQLGVILKQLPVPDENTALCNICKVLTDEQMKSIPANMYNQIKWKYKNLLEWYEQHCKDDKEFNKGIEELA